MLQTQNTLQPGMEIFHGTYRILRVLGKGGFGITYLAHDLSLDRRIAIKEFFPENFCVRDTDTSQMRVGVESNTPLIDKLKQKFIKEARNLAKLSYPGIIRIYNAFEENGTAYYVMDYIEGETLSQLVRSVGPLPEDRALKYARQIGQSLEYIHRHHINHLDVKPANILIRQSDDQPILIDFGLSKQYDKEGHQTSTTPTGISHGYAPLEQYSEGGVNEFSPRTDLYSLAATLYYMLTGETPPKSVELIETGLNFPPQIPSHIQSAIRKAMSGPRAARHESVGQFLEHLDNPAWKDKSEDTCMPGFHDGEEDTQIQGFYGGKEDTQIRGLYAGAGGSGTGGGNGAGNGPSPTPFGEPNKPKKKAARAYIIASVALAVVIAGIFFMLQYNASVKRQQAIQDSIRIADSLAKVEADSIAAIIQDSIARRNFSTPDLAFNDLHGDVKESKIIGGGYGYYTEERYRNTSYDEEGNWLNVPQWRSGQKEYFGSGLPLNMTERDHDGKIINIYWSNDDDYYSFNYEWRDGRIVADDYGEYEYSDDGLRIAYLMNDIWIQPSRIVYTDYVVDNMGNWIERTANYFRYEGGLTYPTDKGVEKERRVITYYNSSGGGRIAVPNSEQQLKLLKEERDRYNRIKEQQNYYELEAPPAE